MSSESPSGLEEGQKEVSSPGMMPVLLQQVWATLLPKHKPKLVSGGPIGFQLEVEGLVSEKTAIKLIEDILGRMANTESRLPHVTGSFLGQAPEGRRVGIFWKYARLGVHRNSPNPMSLDVFGPDQDADPVDLPEVWLPAECRVSSSWQLTRMCPPWGRNLLPLVFTAYGPGEGAEFNDWRLLITPLPGGDNHSAWPKGRGFRPEVGSLPRYLQEIYEHFQGSCGACTYLIPGGPLGIQVEVQWLRDFRAAYGLLDSLLKTLREDLPDMVPLACNPVEGCLPERSVLYSCFQMKPFPALIGVGPPFVFSIYKWLGGEDNSNCFFLLVTPLLSSPETEG